MKSSTFRRLGLPDRAESDLKLISSLSKEKIALLLDWLDRKESWPTIALDGIESLSKETDLNGDTCLSFLYLVRFFLRVIIDYNDNIADIYDDIKNLEILEDENKYSQINLIFERIPELTRKFLPTYRESVSRYFGQPEMSGCNVAAVIKPVYRRRPEYGAFSIKDYQPEPLCYTVMGQVEISTSSDEAVSFQVNIEELDKWLTDLLLLQAEMKQMSEDAKSLSDRLDSGRGSNGS